MVEFLGSKREMSPAIVQQIAQYAAAGATVADLFCGTASVSLALRHFGYRVVANDHLALCTTFAEALLLNDGTPAFSAAAATVGRAGGGYLGLLHHLNALEGSPGFIHRTYSPASIAYSGIERRYFTEENAARIDAIRAEIAALEPTLSRGERSLLLADLLRAASAVSNTAGTFGCFLKSWKKRALEPIVVRPTTSLASGPSHNEVTCDDALRIAPNITADAAYADPPYTKRQYAAYYHVLETIARADEPVVTGRTGLRHWQEQQSEFCYKRRAAAALDRLVARVRCRYFFLSYSDDGHLSDGEIRSILGRFGHVSMSERAHRRYRSSGLAHSRSTVLERLYILEVSPSMKARDHDATAATSDASASAIRRPREAGASRANAKPPPPTHW